MYGRLYRCAEHQLKALPPSAELARRRLIEFQKNGAVMVGNPGVSALQPDAKLRTLLNSQDDELTYFNLQRYLKIHFQKEVAK